MDFVAVTWHPWSSLPAVSERQELFRRSCPFEKLEAVTSAHLLKWCGVWIDGSLRTGFSVEITRSRAVPGGLNYRMDRVGGARLDALEGYELDVLRSIRKSMRRAVRLTVSVYEERPEKRQLLEQALRGAGMNSTPPRTYVDTLIAPILADDTSQLHSFSSSTRRNIREAVRGGLSVRPITYHDHRRTINGLIRESFVRHGRTASEVDPESLMSGKAESSALFGAFSPTDEGMEQLVGFAAFKRFSHVCVYDAAGTLKRPELGRMPISYPLLLEGFRWGRSQGCTTLDLGGVPPLGSQDDPRASIASFKSGFGGSRVTIGGEWQCKPSPWLSRIERTVRSLRKLR